MLNFSLVNKIKDITMIKTYSKFYHKNADNILQFGHLLLLKCCSGAKIFLSDVFKKGTQAKRHQKGELQCGRSMIEMLGVLAIIGVLSVGAIAGYSNAMLKYKLNKQSEQLNQVINTVARFAHSFGELKEVESMFPYLIKMGEIPKEMIKNNYNSNIYDVFNTTITARVQPYSATTEGAIKGVIALGINPELSKKSNQNFEICKNIYTTIKESSSNIYYVYSMSGYGTNDQRSGTFYGDGYCSENNKCLKDLTIEKIYQECSQHTGNTSSGHIMVLWKL